MSLSMWTNSISESVLWSFTRSWKVFSDDKDRPNRYQLAKELISRPDAEELEVGCQNFTIFLQIGLDEFSSTQSIILLCVYFFLIAVKELK
jgi:hypothetical protein